jgi:hypothetical protein
VAPFPSLSSQDESGHDEEDKNVEVVPDSDQPPRKLVGSQGLQAKTINAETDQVLTTLVNGPVSNYIHVYHNCSWPDISADTLCVQEGDKPSGLGQVQVPVPGQPTPVPKPALPSVEPLAKEQVSNCCIDVCHLPLDSLADTFCVQEGDEPQGLVQEQAASPEQATPVPKPALPSVEPLAKEQVSNCYIDVCHLPLDSLADTFCVQEGDEPQGLVQEQVAPPEQATPVPEPALHSVEPLVKEQVSNCYMMSVICR